MLFAREKKTVLVRTVVVVKHFLKDFFEKNPLEDENRNVLGFWT